MNSPNTVQTIPDIQKPRVLIIGQNAVVGYLYRSLDEKNCSVTCVESTTELFQQGKPEKYEYVFLLSDSDDAQEIERKYVSPETKFIVIETEESEGKASSYASGKTLQVGALEQWDVKELAEKILDVQFSQNTGVVIDVKRRGKIVKEKKIDRQGVKERQPFPQGDHKLSQVEKIAKKRTVVTPPVQVNRVSLWKSVLIIVLLYLAGVLAVLGFLGMEYRETKALASGILDKAYQGKWSDMEKDLVDFRKHLQTTRSLVNVSSLAFYPIRKSVLFSDARVIMSVCDNLAISAQELLAYIRSKKGGGENMSMSSFSLKPFEYREVVQKLTAVKQTVKTSQDALRSGVFFSSSRNELVKRLEEANTVLTQIETLRPLYEMIVLQEAEASYLLLFQNNMEIRPTGGFIGSVGFLNSEKGTIREFTVQDVYSLDGQLKGHVEPPQPFAKYMNQPNWFLRDSNFDPDFFQSAQAAEWFLQKEVSRSVDGVIAVNLYPVQEMLQVIGPVQLTDFQNKEIRFDNFFFEAQRHTQNDFFPGSTQKKDFLTAVTNAVIQKLLSSGPKVHISLLEVLKKNLDEKNIVLAFDDPKKQSEVEKNGWGGRISRVSCVGLKEQQSSTEESQEKCLADYVSVIDTNVGVNKANYAVSKSLHMQKSINSSGQIATILTINYTYENLPDEVVHTGEYKNYLRVFVPRGARLISVVQNNMPLSPLDVDVVEYGEDKTAFGTLVRVERGKTVGVKIAYMLEETLTPQTTKYQLLLQKQSGEKTSPVAISVDSRASYALQPFNLTAAPDKNGSLQYTTDTSVDRIFLFDIKRK